MLHPSQIVLFEYRYLYLAHTMPALFPFSFYWHGCSAITNCQSTFLDSRFPFRTYSTNICKISFLHSFIHSKIYKAPLQEIYSEAPPAQPRRYRSVLSNLQNALSLFFISWAVCYIWSAFRQRQVTDRSLLSCLLLSGSQRSYIKPHTYIAHL